MTQFCQANLLDKILLPQWGMVKKESELQLDEEAFSCCGATGFYHNDEDDSFYQCNLKERWRKAQAIIKKFKLHSQKDENAFPILNEKQYKYIQKWFQDFIEKKVYLGICTKHNPKKEISTLWSVALFGAFKFNLDCIVLIINDTCSQELIKRLDYLNENSVVFLIQQKELWEGASNYEFEAVVNICEKSEIPIWIDFMDFGNQSVPSNTLKSFDVKKQFIKQKIKQPASFWVDEACKSRIKNTSMNASKHGFNS